LRALETYILSADAGRPDREARRAVQEADLQRAGLTRLRRPPNAWATAPHVQEHNAALLAILEAALAAPMFSPFLLVDATTVADESSSPLLDVPVGADAVFLGTSPLAAAFNASGYVPHNEGVVHSPTGGQGLMRVFNAMAFHAVLIASEPFARNLQRCALEGMLRRAPATVLAARTQRYYKVYSVITPRLHQSARLGGDEPGTRRPLHGVRIAGPEGLPARVGFVEAPSVAVDLAMAASLRRLA
ncbi:MAG TPA: hypothetical protein VFH51_19410, partial [Myxococcota bacterium]|nr:hypothetical protein [Myxococcota bacterium]